MRKSTTIKIKDRNNELTFKITEMPATQLENWSIKALMLAAASGIEVPDGAGVETAAKVLLANPAALSGIDYNKIKPLLDEMLGCCSRIDAGVEQVCTVETIDGYIEDMRTILKLRIEAVKFNFSFLAEENPSSSQEPQHITINAKKRA